MIMFIIVCKMQKKINSNSNILAKSVIFDNTPAETWFGPRIFCTLKLSDEPNFYNLG